MQDNSTPQQCEHMAYLPQAQHHCKFKIREDVQACVCSVKLLLKIKRLVAYYSKQSIICLAERP